MSEIKIRRLKKKDRTTFGNLIKKLVERTNKDELINMVVDPSSSTSEDTESSESSESEKGQTAEILSLAFSLLEGFLQFVEDDLTVWFMDLIGVKNIEDYNNLDFDIETTIINQILEAKEFKRFFSMGSQVSNKIKNLANQ